MKNLLILALMALPSWAAQATLPVATASTEFAVGPFWHGRSFVNRSSDAMGSTTTTFRFSADGKSGVMETSGTIMGSAYSGRNEFSVVSATSSQLVIKYTSATDRDLAPYIVGKKETLSLNASRQTVEYNGDEFR